jgi:hypothetical protein
MEERGNKTIMCSVLFLDIVEYSKKSVTGQISLKDRFNSYLSAAIRDVPMTDRIILDTGDGAAINFLGDVEDALNAALSLRESLLNEKLDVEYPLLVRMGINLGPVCLVRDINGQPNIVGDGINVAQRVMGFAEAVQILVSRSYYDAVSRLSPQYAGMFHYQGSRTDKHVREHEVYAIGYPGDKSIRGNIKSHSTSQLENNFSPVIQYAKEGWTVASTKLDTLVEQAMIRFGQAGAAQRTIYIGILVVPLILLIAILATRTRPGVTPVLPAVKNDQQVKVDQDALVVGSSPSANSPFKASPISVPPSKPVIASKPKAKKSSEKRIAAAPPLHADIQEKVTNKITIDNSLSAESPGDNSNAYISVACVEGTEVFIDGVRKGRLSFVPLTIKVPPGKHAVIVSHTSRGIFTQSVELHPGKTMHIKPSLCN